MHATALLLAALSLPIGRAVAQTLSLEGGVDAFRQNFTSERGEVLGQARVAPSVTLSGYLQVPALRSYYGLLATGHAGHAEPPPDAAEGSTSRATQTTVAGLLGWRGFVLDLQGDCDCPTWREEKWLRKALFVEAGLGYGRQTFDAEGGGLASTARSGVAYFTRVGLAHRVHSAVDLLAAVGYQGILGRDVGYGVHHGAARPTVGVVWRP